MAPLWIIPAKKNAFILTWRHLIRTVPQWGWLYFKGMDCDLGSKSFASCSVSVMSWTFPTALWRPGSTRIYLCPYPGGTEEEAQWAEIACLITREEMTVTVRIRTQDCRSKAMLSAMTQPAGSTIFAPYPVCRTAWQIMLLTQKKQYLSMFFKEFVPTNSTGNGQRGGCISSEVGCTDEMCYLGSSNCLDYVTG